MKFYSNKTKPKCGKWIKTLTDLDSIECFIVVPENKKELDSDEYFWSEWKEHVIVWQYEDNFDTLIKKRIYPKSWREER